jgi:hypothetical protein
LSADGKSVNIPKPSDDDDEDDIQPFSSNIVRNSIITLAIVGAISGLASWAYSRYNKHR